MTFLIEETRDDVLERDRRGGETRKADDKRFIRWRKPSSEDHDLVKIRDAEGRRGRRSERRERSGGDGCHVFGVLKAVTLLKAICSVADGGNPGCDGGVRGHGHAEEAVSHGEQSPKSPSTMDLAQVVPDDGRVIVAGMGKLRGVNGENNLGAGLPLLLTVHLHRLQVGPSGRFLLAAIDDAKKVVFLQVSLHLELPVIIVALIELVEGERGHGESEKSGKKSGGGSSVPQQ
jgi:hypothetical protein